MRRGAGLGLGQGVARVNYRQRVLAYDAGAYVRRVCADCAETEERLTVILYATEQRKQWELYGEEELVSIWVSSNVYLLM